MIQPSPVGPLSPDQMEFFHRQGYLVVEDLFSDEDLQPVIEAITQHREHLLLSQNLVF